MLTSWQQAPLCDACMMETNYIDICHQQMVVFYQELLVTIALYTLSLLTVQSQQIVLLKVSLDNQPQVSVCMIFNSKRTL